MSDTLHERPGLALRERFAERVFTQVINLDRSPERLAAIDGGLRAAGISYHRLPAVDGRQLDLERDPTIRRVIDRRGWMKRHHRNPTVADIGCYLSHLAALERFLEQPRALGLVFEDDAEIAPDFLAMTWPALADAEAWDILKLHARHPGPLIPRRSYPDAPALCSFVTRHAGATAYMVSREAARRMLAHMVPAVKMNDWAYDEGHKMKLRVRTLARVPVRLQAVPSTIETERRTKGNDQPPRSWLERQTDRPLLPRWQLPFRRTADACHRVWYNLISDGGLLALIVGLNKP